MFLAGYAFINTLSKSLVAGRRHFSSPGLTTHRGSDLKLQRGSWQYYNASLAITLAADFSSCGRTTPPGCCTCRGWLRWRAVKAGEPHFRWCYKLNHTFDTCREFLNFESFTATDKGN